METQFFYNCTLPYFGPLCQYKFDEHEPYYTSLNEIIHDSYLFTYQSDTFTCYIHLQCNRGLVPIYLDWTEICNGEFDCVNGEQDEEHCWQLEINECQANEYRCQNGQCIPEDFFRDDIYTPDCFDISDENFQQNSTYKYCTAAEPTFGCEDVACVIPNIIDPLRSLTSSCLVRRYDFIKEQILIKPNSTSEFCWSLFKCFIDVSTIIENEECYELLRQNCNQTFYVPTESSLSGGLYFTYVTEKMSYLSLNPASPIYLCVKDRFCDKMLLLGKIPFDRNISCYLLEHFLPSYNPQYSYPPLQLIEKFMSLDWACYSIINNRSELCEKSNMYQCINMSKCISRYRINDQIIDCLYGDDEFFNLPRDAQVVSQFGKFFTCSQRNACIPYRLVKDGICHCGEEFQTLCEDENPELIDAKKNISFQVVCDSFVDLLPIIIGGRNETDETECEQWSCNNSYTHCDGHWNCLSGFDEIDCNPTSLLNCSSKHHRCVSAETNRLTCLPLDKAGDGNIDYIGATDEPSLCQFREDLSRWGPFYCEGYFETRCIPITALCNNFNNCLSNDDERFCEKNNLTTFTSICETPYASIRSNAEKFICEYPYQTERWPIVHFSLGEIGSSSEPILHIDDKTVTQHSLNTRRYEQLCHRGLHVRLWLDKKKNLTTIICLCPPSFYGDLCQYQNQRVSLTIQFRSLSDVWRTPFAVVISLIDDSYDRTIHSVEQLMYLPIRDCQRKFNVYLLYSTRPKNQSKNYSIHIDFYEKISLAYRGSFLLSIPFQFLPINRLAVHLNITSDRDIADSCSKHQCVHGQCIKYMNVPMRMTFCRCHQGWSGRSCTIPHHCTCSSNSLCTGVLANNRSICVCRIGHFGPRCLLMNPVCQLNGNATCKNGGQCIPQQEYVHSNKKYTCICRNGFTGERCENHDVKITISFHKDIKLPLTMLVHFIQVKKSAAHERATTFKTIPPDQDSVTLYWSHPFHIVFIELFNKNYYLAVIQRLYKRSLFINKRIDSKYRCKHISELFNETMVKLHLVRRIKYYHLPCQQKLSVNLSCFYDDVHLCLCENDGHQRSANCFKFEHDMKLDCLGQGSCENGGRCFQDSPNCAQTSVCICATCVYGKICQFIRTIFRIPPDEV
ncbi:unnamed protein product [Rotaria magnacalcarata]|uniref:EGF-like domain-containing protein n=2 Tax=Rotaria magnacalcarata TaxID=392030 RepID=A0A816A8Z3_9BILA|nr:unnamed protein product [Rotaria magnacalcarata]